MLPAARLLAEGKQAAPKRLCGTAFLRGYAVASEVDYKRMRMAEGTVMYHMHLGLSTWDATVEALHEVHSGLSSNGYRIDRFGVAFDRAMGVPEATRHLATKETGPRVGRDQWPSITELPVQAHLGDFMIGFPAGFHNTVSALEAGVTTIGNIGQYMAFDLVGGSDEIMVTEETVRALGAIAALRDQGALAHSNLDDGSNDDAAHYGNYVGWAAIEIYVVETLVGARLAHCFGNTVQNPDHRAILHFALDDLRNRDSIGSMIYGNTVDHRAGDRSRNQAATASQIRCDIALQLRRPTGHAVNPVPFTEAERIPSAQEILEVHLLAHETEHEVRRTPDLYDWERLERLGADVARYATTFRDRALHVLADDGVDVSDAAAVLLALRRTSVKELEARIELDAPDEIAKLVPWRAATTKRLGDTLSAHAPSLRGVRIVLAVLEVHDVVRNALLQALPRSGAEVVLLGADTPIEGVARAAANEDAAAIVLGTYNGNALQLGDRLVAAAAAAGWDGPIFMGGILNQDHGDGLPTDARPALTAIGVRCVDRVEDLFGLLSNL